MPKEVVDLFHAIVAKLSPSHPFVPMDPTGDGALIFFKTSLQAVRFADELLDKLHISNCSEPLKQWHRKVRIGIGTGSVFLSARYAPDGAVVAFEAAGDAIIDAVRLQAASREKSMCISDKTRIKLPGSWPDRFESPKALKAKKYVVIGCHYKSRA